MPALARSSVVVLWLLRLRRKQLLLDVSEHSEAIAIGLLGIGLISPGAFRSTNENCRPPSRPENFENSS
jgi:hypothetical protein